MRIAYLFNLSESAADHMNVDKVFIDTSRTGRRDRSFLLDDGGIRQGQTLVITKYSQLGHGAEAKRIREMFEAMGVTVEVCPLPDAPKAGRRPMVVMTDDQKKYFCGLWHSSVSSEYVLRRAREELGQPVDRNFMNYNCGPRGGKS